MTTITLQRPAGLLCWGQLYLLYRRSFPRAERKPFRLILKAWHQGRTHIWCIREGHRFLGFASTMNGESHVMLDYFVIRPRFRGRGIGTAAMAQLLSLYSGQGFFLEIESPYEPGPDRQLRQRRKEFYCRCGLEPLQIRARVYGVPMELLGINCRLDFSRYRAFYRDFYKPCSARHILPMDPPEGA